MSRWAKSINPNLVERLAGLVLVGVGVAAWSLPAAAVAVGGIILALDVLDWVLTWANARPKGAE